MCDKRKSARFERWQLRWRATGELAMLGAAWRRSRMAEIPEHIGPYRVLSVVGEGGMGVVYKAEDQRLERIVALKVIREFEGDTSRKRRFWQEARAAAQVTHPNACRIYDIAEEQDRLVLVMEFIDGESLARRLERGSLPAQEAGQIALALPRLLEFFLGRPGTHRPNSSAVNPLTRARTYFPWGRFCSKC